MRLLDIAPLKHLILNSSTLDTIMLTENPFCFSTITHIAVTNARG